MKKILIILILLLFPLNAIALTYPTLHYKNAIVYDLTDDKVLYEQSSNEKVAMASLTKIMTIITAIENIEDLNKEIIYSQTMKNNVAWYASVAGFKVGDRLTVNDLLHGAMLPSGADAVVALAITTSGSIDEFVKLMNDQAKKIGMTNTNFVNVHGLDEENHYSTAKDLQQLLEYSLENETFKKVYTTKEYTLSTGKLIKSTILKTNSDTTKIIGSKTGFTGDAGLCISVLMNHKNHDIIFITLGAPSNENEPHHINDAVSIINFIENNYNNQTLIEKNQTIKTLKVELSKITQYKIKATKEISKFLENDYNKDDITIKYDGIKTLTYKNKKGEKLGTVKYYYQNEEIASEDVYLTTEIKPDYLKILNKYKWQIIVIGIICLSLIVLIRKKLIKRRSK